MEKESLLLGLVAFVMYYSMSPLQKHKTNIRVNNWQSLVRINRKNVTALAKAVIDAESKFPKVAIEMSITFVDDAQMRKFNRKHCQKSKSTDVLAFAIDSLTSAAAHCFLGEVVVSVERAKKVAVYYDHSVQEEIVLYIIHGILHLIGWRDKLPRQRRLMEIRQEELLKKLYKKV